MGSSTQLLALVVRWLPLTPGLANICGCTGSTRVSVGLRLRGDCLDVAWRIATTVGPGRLSM